MSNEHASTVRSEQLKAIQKEVEREGLERRDDPNFSLLDFVREMIERHGGEAVPLFYGLNTVARNWFSGYSMELLGTISAALGLTVQTNHTEIVEKMMPFLAIEGKTFARTYLAMMGFSKEEIEKYEQEASFANRKNFNAGELVF